MALDVANQAGQNIGCGRDPYDLRNYNYGSIVLSGVDGYFMGSMLPMGAARSGGRFLLGEVSAAERTLGPVAGSGARATASSAAQGARLRQHLRQWDRYGTQGFRQLENGRFRYYGDVRPANNPGDMIGRRLVREWDPATGATRTWHETLDATGTVRQVRPVTDGVKVHHRFDANGNYAGSW